jgi:hypothetical protein
VNELNDRLNEIVSSLGSVRDEDIAALSATPGARALFEEIVSTPRSEHTGLTSRVGRARGGPVRVGVAAAAAVFVLVLGVVVGSQVGRPKEAVAFSIEGDHIVARIVDPEATKQELEAAFAERGLDFRVILVPASPSIVGTIGAMYAEGVQGGDVEILHEEGACFTPGGGDKCPVGLKIVNDFDGRLNIEIGRRAAPGEPYAMATEAFAPGEALHCSGVRGQTVRDALPALADSGVRVIWRTIGKGDDVQGMDPATIADQYVTDSQARAEGEVWIWVWPTRPNFNPKVTAMLDRGC